MQASEEKPNDMGEHVVPLQPEKSKQSATIPDEKSVANGEVEDEDQFAPLSGVEPYDGRTILTVRSVAAGVVLGALIACSNIYLGTLSRLPDVDLNLRVAAGLKTGFGADATMFSAIFGYAICKLLEKSKVHPSPIHSQTTS